MEKITDASRTFTMSVLLLIFVLGAVGVSFADDESGNTPTQYATVYGHVLTGQLFVPNARVEVSCTDTGESVRSTADSRGMYFVSLPCTKGGKVSVSAVSGSVRICLNPVFCLPYGGGFGSGKGVVSRAGYSLVNVPLKTVY